MLAAPRWATRATASSAMLTTSCERAPDAVRDEADAAGVVLPAGVERGRGRHGRVAMGRIGRTGTGRVDPLPRGGHGTSCW